MNPTLTAEQQKNETEAQAKRFGIEPTISAKELVQPVQPVQVSEPITPPPLPSNATVNAVRDESNNLIAAQTEEAKQLKDMRGQYAALADEGTLSDLFTAKQDEFGLPQNLKELKDINLQLADMQTGSDLTKVRIEGAAGQTVGQGQREVTQEDREAAVRSQGLAMRAAVLQGNIETAQALASNAVEIAYQDRQLKNTNLLNQIKSLEGTVDGQTQQLLNAEARKYEEDQLKVEELKNNIQAALISGATASEVNQLTLSKLSDEQKMALSQEIIARGANQMRDLEVQQQQATLDATRALEAQRYSKGGSNSVTPGTVTFAAGTSGTMGTDEDPIPSLLSATAGGRLLTQSEAEPLTNAKRVADGLQDLQATIQGANTDPILGVFKRVNPYNLEAATIDAAITQLVPQLARGTYGEVGVLTDADVARYSNTLPNLTNTEEQNKAVMALTLRKVRSGLVSQLESMAAAGRDVSGFVGIYDKFNQQIAELENAIGVGSASVQQIDEEYDDAFGGTSQTTTQVNDQSDGFFKRIGKFLFGE